MSGSDGYLKSQLHINNDCLSNICMQKIIHLFNEHDNVSTVHVYLLEILITQ